MLNFHMFLIHIFFRGSIGRVIELEWHSNLIGWRQIVFLLELGS